MNSNLKRAVALLVEDLAAKRYGDIVSDGRAGQLTEVELRNLVVTYGRTLVTLPEEAWSLVDVHEQIGDPTSLTLDVPLWTAEEGRSDLTLLINAKTAGDVVRLEIDDIHVL